MRLWFNHSENFFVIRCSWKRFCNMPWVWPFGTERLFCHSCGQKWIRLFESNNVFTNVLIVFVKFIKTLARDAFELWYFQTRAVGTALYSLSSVIFASRNVIYVHFPFPEMCYSSLSLLFVRILEDGQESTWTHSGDERGTFLKGEPQLYSPLSKSLWSEEWRLAVADLASFQPLFSEHTNSWAEWRTPNIS